MIIIGVDPGTARLGWGVIESQGSNVQAIAYGCVTTPKDQAPETRLSTIYSSLQKILKTHTPDVMAIEALFFSVNVKTAIPVGEARGIVLLASSQAKIPVVSYTPPVIKQTITGSGNAQKPQIGRMVQLLLKLKKIPEPDDTADALAIAMTHAFTKRFGNKAS